jgi:hypothetical protein
VTKRIYVAVPKEVDQEHLETADASNALPCADTLDAA